MGIERVEDSQLVKMPPSQLREGMYIARLDRPWLNSPFIFQGFPLKTKDELRKIQSLCEYVYVDMRKSRLMTRHVAAQSLDDLKPIVYKNAAEVTELLAGSL